jgi:hypothetical protein
MHCTSNKKKAARDNAAYKEYGKEVSEGALQETAIGNTEDIDDVLRRS